MLRATPELAKLTTTRTGPPRSPQPLAALATRDSAATRSERLGPPSRDVVARELPRFQRVPVRVLMVLAADAPSSGRSVTDTVGTSELARDVVLPELLAGSQAGAAPAVALGASAAAAPSPPGGCSLA